MSKAWTKAPTKHSAAQPKSDDTFYFKSEMVTFKVENTLFRVPKSGFNVEGTSLEVIFALHVPLGEEGEDIGEAPPIVLDGILEVHFRGFLRGIYPSMAKTPWSHEELVGALLYGTLWGFWELRKQAIDRLAPLLQDNTAYNNIMLARECKVGPWLINIYAGLILEKEPLGLIELCERGIDSVTVGKLFRIREEIRAHDSDAQVHKETIGKIKQSFAAELASMDPQRSVVSKPIPMNSGLEQDGVREYNDEVPFTTPDRKYVFAHFLVKNTYLYTVDSWLEDIKLAASQEIDGFILRVEAEDWHKQRCIDCFAAAEKLPDATEFSFLLCFDMEFFPSAAANDVQPLRDFLEANYKKPRMFKHPLNGNVVVSTKGGDLSTFGQGGAENGWAYVKAELNKLTPIFFNPSFFTDLRPYSNIDAIDSASNWEGGWPIQLISAKSTREEIQNAAIDTDNKYIELLISRGRSYMAVVSPWYFSHDDENIWYRNLVYRSDDWLFVRRWEHLVAVRDRIEMVQIMSWNDYGESHYIGPIKKTQPDLPLWIDGYPHIAWLYLNRYFMKAFQTGTYPAITEDRIFLWARPHPRDSTCADPLPLPLNYELVDDMAWMVVLSTAPAKIDTYTTDSDDSKVTFHVSAGMSKLSFPLKTGGGMRAVMLRNNIVVTECSPVAYRFEGRPGFYNFNAYVAMSP